MFMRVNSKCAHQVRPPLPRSEVQFDLLNEARKRRPRQIPAPCTDVRVEGLEEILGRERRIAQADATRDGSTARCQACALGLHDGGFVHRLHHRQEILIRDDLASSAMSMSAR